MRIRATAALAALAGIATTANAALISFASESGVGPTLQSAFSGGVTTVTDVNNPLKLLRVAAETGGSTTRFNRDISLTLTATLSNPTPVGGNIVFRLDAFSFELRDVSNPDGATNLMFRFTSLGREQGLFLGLGNGQGNGIVAASITSDGRYEVGAGIAPDLGLPGPTTVNGQASFTLTGFDPAEVSYIYQGSQIVGLTEFNASSSFSGSFTVPTPGTLVLAGVAGLALAFRRR